MSTEPEPIVVNVYADEPVTGLWCHQCQLPSVTRTIVRVGHPESETFAVVHQCEDVPEHVLIEGQQ
jgi:hypothetical protein